MSRINKFMVSAALCLPLLAGGCKPSKGSANPEDYFPLIQVALGAGETGAMIGRNEAIKAQNRGGCVAAESMITAFDSANQILTGSLEDKVVIPAISIDVSDCSELKGSDSEAPAEGASTEDALKGSQDAAVLFETLAGITLAAVKHYAARLKTANCGKGTAALGVVLYVEGMVGPISAEIADPDGKVDVPAVTIDLSECEE